MHKISVKVPFLHPVIQIITLRFVRHQARPLPTRVTLLQVATRMLALVEVVLETEITLQAQMFTVMEMFVRVLSPQVQIQVVIEPHLLQDLMEMEISLELLPELGKIQIGKTLKFNTRSQLAVGKNKRSNKQRKKI